MTDPEIVEGGVDPRLAIGGNNPPAASSELALMLSPAVLRDQAELDHAKLVRRRDELLAGVVRFFEAVKVIDSLELQARASDFVRQLKLHWTETEAARKAEVAPFDAGKAVYQKFFKAENLDPIERSYKDIEAKMTVFARAEAKRVEAEQAAEKKRLQDIADKAAAEALAAGGDRPSLFEVAAEAAKTAEKGPKKVATTVRGTASSASLRTRFTFEEVDLTQVPREWLCLDRTRAQQAIDGGLRDAEDGTPAIPGLRIVDASRVTVRR